MPRLGDTTCGAPGLRAAVALGFAALPVPAILAAAALALWPDAAGAQTAQDPHALAEAAVRKLDLQTALVHEPAESAVTLALPPEAIWIAIVVGLCVLLYAFRDMIPLLGGRSRVWANDAEAASPARAGEPEVALGAADELAAQGRFVEAMHVLLLQALAEIRRRLDEPFADSMTSREILRSNRLADALRHPLREVVQRVERTYFGAHPAAQDDYLACRASFRALAAALYRSADA